MLGWLTHAASGPRHRARDEAAGIYWYGREAVVIVTGELDCATGPALSARLAGVLASRPRRLVIDLAGVTFMDCSGIRPLVQARAQLPEDSPLVLRSPAPLVRRLLKITHLDQACVIDYAPAGTEAVAAT
jgi:anti-anti-sigma factor